MDSLEVFVRSEYSWAESFRVLGEIAQRSVEAFDRLCESLVEMQVAMYPHKRSLYLTTHGSPKVQKKNRKRYERWFKKVNHV